MHCEAVANVSYVYIIHLVTNIIILIPQYICHNLAFEYHTINITYTVWP